MNSYDEHFKFAVELSRDALKGLLLVNGGAATALIALMDKTSGSKNYTIAVMLFGAGAALSVASTCFGYLSQLNYANHRMEIENHQDGNRSHNRHKRWLMITILMVGVALLCTVVGIISAAYTAHG